jgi:hypothetical protein
MKHVDRDTRPRDYLSLASIWLLLCLVVACGQTSNREMSESHKVINEFMNSSLTTIDATSVFGPGWSRVCLSSDYANRGYIESVLGRELSLSEMWLWWHSGRDEEGVYNFLLERNGVLERIEIMDMKIIRYSYGFRSGCHDYMGLRFEKYSESGRKIFKLVRDTDTEN